MVAQYLGCSLQAAALEVRYLLAAVALAVAFVRLTLLSQRAPTQSRSASVAWYLTLRLLREPTAVHQPHSAYLRLEAVLAAQGTKIFKAKMAAAEVVVVEQTFTALLPELATRHLLRQRRATMVA